MGESTTRDSCRNLGVLRGLGSRQLQGGEDDFGAPERQSQPWWDNPWQKGNMPSQYRCLASDSVCVLFFNITCYKNILK